MRKKPMKTEWIIVRHKKKHENILLRRNYTTSIYEPLFANHLTRPLCHLYIIAHNGVISCKRFPHYGLFVRGIHLWQENSPKMASNAEFYHYNDVIMGAMASQITSLTIVYSTVYSDADQRKHQSSASLACVRGTHRGPVNSPHKWPVTRKMFPVHDVIMHIKHMHLSSIMISDIPLSVAAFLHQCHR